METKIKLDWSEMDLFGHINNVAYFKYIQTARVNYLESVGINTSDPENKLSFAVASSNCNFKKPLFFPGEIKVFTSNNWIKNTSIELKHVIYDVNGEIAAESTDIIVLFDYATQTKRNVPDEVRMRMNVINDQ